MARIIGVLEVMGANRHKYLFGALFLVLTATGCVSRDYMEMYDLPATGWQADQSVVFTYQPDSTAFQKRGLSTAVAAGPRDGEWIDITVRHTRDFPYADLPLEIKGVAPDKQFWTDTIDFPLGSPSGSGIYQWSGRPYSNHYDITKRYRSGIRYRRMGEYSLSVRQLTGRDTLHGILSIGVIASGAQVIRSR